MTLILAIKCSDGIVIAADSASSDLDAGTKQPTEKIKKLGNHTIVYGGSGDVGLLQKLGDAVNGLNTTTSIKRIRQELKKLAVPELKDSAELHVRYPRQGFHEPPEAILLFAGVTARTPWILEIEKDGRDTIYGDDLGNFAAIGSGKPLAQAIFRPHLKSQRDLNLGKIFAYRVIDDAIELSVMGLCHPIHISTIDLDGTILKVEAAELQALRTQCELWRSVEREALGRVLAPQPMAGTGTITEPLLDIPAPKQTPPTQT
ncbi:MAG: hypothetical protein HY651_08485 [Acidobacteria bacterium]|nr:hypothetical protein [Acidobacteriota bacterium]